MITGEERQREREREWEREGEARRTEAPIISGGIYSDILYLKRNFNTLMLLELGEFRNVFRAKCAE